MGLLNSIYRIIKSKKARKMAKNAKKRGHSARNGNSPAPYTKYKKRPYKYSWEHKDENIAKEKEQYARKKAA